MDEYCVGQVGVQTQEELVLVMWSNFPWQVQGVVPSSPSWSEILGEEFFGEVDFFLTCETQNSIAFKNVRPIKGIFLNTIFYGCVFMKASVTRNLTHDSKSDCRNRDSICVFCGLHHNHIRLVKPGESRKTKEVKKGG